MDYDVETKDDKNLETIKEEEWVNDSSLLCDFIVYLTKVVHRDLKTAAKNVKYWSGVTTMMPLLGGFLADAYGLILLTMSELIPGLKPCDVAMNGSSTTTMCQHRSPKVHEVVFFIAIYMISTSTGCHKPSLESFGADQYDESHAQERKKKMCYFNWWNFGLCSGLILGVTMVGHIQQRISWVAGHIIITVIMIVTIAVFCAGRPFYRCIIDLNQTKIQRNPWRPATVTGVEEVKLLLKMIPIWLTTMTFGICKIGGGGFELPPASTYCLAAIGMILSLCVYDRILVPGINILPRKGIGIEDGFALVGLQEYFYDQSPESMRSLGIAFYLSVLGVADFLSNILITVVDRISGLNGRSIWFGKYIDNSHFCCILGLLCHFGT
ncbi:hypothetical protein MKW92_022079 [Papaver armeniacum]|nr:hypothetical protein MKW92_022079 [Papaver armeniacum]